VKHTARGPKPARCVVESGPLDDFVNQTSLFAWSLFSYTSTGD